MKAAVAMLTFMMLTACRSEPPPLVTVNDARVIALPTSAAAYFTLANSGGDDRLVRIETPRIGQASLHETSMTDGIMRMRELSGGIDVPGGATIKLSPSGKHVMIQGLARPLEDGSSIRLTLTFERQGAVTIDAPVGRPR